MKSVERRRMLGWLALTPLGIGMGCARDIIGSDAGGPDSGRVDAGRGDDAGNGGDAGACIETETDALGPFYERGAPARMRIADASEPGEVLLIESRLVAADNCRIPLAGYTVDVWQADADGDYHRGMVSGYRLRGQMQTDADGRFSLQSIVPGNYDGRPSHLHLRIYNPSGNERLTTQLYFAGDPFLGTADSCQPPTCFSYDPARILSLIDRQIDGRAGRYGATQLVVRR